MKLKYIWNTLRYIFCSAKNTQGERGDIFFIFVLLKTLIMNARFIFFPFVPSAVLSRTVYRGIFLILFSTQAVAWFGYDTAASLMQKGDYQGAKEKLQTLLADSPDSAQLLYDAGVASYKTNDYKPAYAYFKQAAQLSNSDKVFQEVANFNAGNAAVELKQLHDAIDHYEKILQFNPYHKPAQHNLEKVKEMLKQQEQPKQQQDKKDNKDQDKQNKEQQDKKSEPEQDQQDKSSSADQEQNDGEQPDDKNQRDNKRNNEPQKSPEQQKDEQQRQKEQQEKEQRGQGDRQKPEQEKRQAEQPQQHDASSDKQQKQKPSDVKDTQEEQGAQEPQEGNVQAAPQKKLDPWLARVLQEQEKKDAALNKQMVKMTVEATMAGQDGQNCW